jgi:CHAT domain-containing protein
LGGKLSLLRGQFGAALERGSAVVDVCRRGGFRQALRSALLDRAQVLLYLNQITATEGLLTWVAEEARVARDERTVARVAWLSALARARARTGLLAGAPSVAEMWVGSLARGRTPPPLETDVPSPDSVPPESFLALFEDRALEVQWALGRGDRETAAAILDGMAAAFGTSESSLIWARLRLLEGMLAYDRGDFFEAWQPLDEACQIMIDCGLKPELWQALRLLGGCSARLGRPEERRQYVRRADEIMGGLDASLSGAQRAIYGWNKWQAEEEFLADEVTELARARDEAHRGPAAGTEEGRALSERLYTLLLRLDRRGRERSRDHLGTSGGEIEDRAPLLEEWLQRFPADRALLSFLVLPERVLLCRAGCWGLDFVVAHVGRRQVRELVARWHRALPGDDGTRSAERVADELAAALRLPEILDTLVPGVCRLTIIPDDSLHAFSFGALRHRGCYLVEHYALTNAFDHFALPPPCPEPAGALTVAVTRGVRPSLEFPRGVLPLLNTRIEANAAACWFQSHGVDSRNLVDDSASRTAVLENWAEMGFVHIACHGMSRPERPDASGLILIPRDEDQPEVLSLRDLSRLAAPHLEHVTLSNCWSADPFILQGNMTIGLPETLCRAGARSVLACLWPVYDAAGAEFSQRFYQHLDTLPRDGALQAAQRDFLASTERRLQNPIYWAGYQLYGAYDAMKWLRSGASQHDHAGGRESAV